MGRLPLLFLLLLPLSGCSSLLTTRLPAPVYYQLDYTPAPLACPQSFSGGLRVSDFATAIPFDRPEMVAIRPAGEVRFSIAFQWIDTPGRMLAGTIERDLSAGTLFPAVFGAGAPVSVPLELTGRVMRFGWLQQGGNSRGVLQVEVSLIAAGASPRVLFHSGYDLQGPPQGQNRPALFAESMSGLAGRFSQQLRRDLCAAAGGRKH